MKLQGNLIDMSIDYKSKKPKITLLINNNINSLEEIESVSLLDIELKKHRRKRSLDANAYCWVLLNKLSERMNIPAIEIYKLEIKEIGVYEVLPIKNEAVDKFKEAWNKNGTGWVCEIIGQSKIDGYTNIKAFYGSSTYDTKQMAKFIDNIVENCKLQGIETASDEELNRYKEMWK